MGGLPQLGEKWIPTTISSAKWSQLNTYLGLITPLPVKPLSYRDLRSGHRRFIRPALPTEKQKPTQDTAHPCDHRDPVSVEHAETERKGEVDGINPNRKTKAAPGLGRRLMKDDE